MCLDDDIIKIKSKREISFSSLVVVNVLESVRVVRCVLAAWRHAHIQLHFDFEPAEARSRLETPAVPRRAPAQAPCLRPVKFKWTDGRSQPLLCLAPWRAFQERATNNISQELLNNYNGTTRKQLSIPRRILLVSQNSLLYNPFTFTTQPNHFQ